MPEFFDVLRQRRSVRLFKEKEVEPEKVLKIFEAINSAPSAGNLQAFEVVIVSEKEKKIALGKAAFGQEFIATAPKVLVFFANPEKSALKYGERGRNLYCLQDVTIAATFALLAINALGLSCVWVGAFNDEKVKEIVNAPKDLKPIAIIPFGFKAEKPFFTGRKSLSELIKKECF
jgi:nitroreductase